MPLSKTAQRLLLRAAKLIGQKHRWIKGQYQKPMPNGEDRFCALGAVMTAADELGIDRWDSERLEWQSAFNQVNDSLIKSLGSRCDRKGKRFDCVPAFNDTRETTHADIKQLFCDTVKREVTDDSILDDPDPAPNKG